MSASSSYNFSTQSYKLKLRKLMESKEVFQYYSKLGKGEAHKRYFTFSISTSFLTTETASKYTSSLYFLGSEPDSIQSTILQTCIQQ